MTSFASGPEVGFPLSPFGSVSRHCCQLISVVDPGVIPLKMKVQSPPFDVVVPSLILKSQHRQAG